MDRFNLLIAITLLSLFKLTAQNSGLSDSKLNAPVEISRLGADGITYRLSMSDTVPTAEKLRIPHFTMFAGPPIGLHSLLSLENISKCCGHDSFTVVVGVLDNSGPLHHTLKISSNDFCLRSREWDLTGGEYHISSAGISFDYQNQTSNSSWLLSNRAGKPGQVLMLNSTADTARWSSVNDFSNVSYFNPASGGVISVSAGSNIIEPASAINALSINLPLNPGNGTIVAFTFAKPVHSITYNGGYLANATTSAAAGTTFKYIYYTGSNKWYNW